jgi:hypothetical protein
MLDVECLGQAPRAALISIGAVEFDPDADASKDTTFYSEIDLDTSIQPWSEVDGDTLRWWMRQNPKAQVAFFGKERLADALRKLTAFIFGSFQPACPKEIWCGPSGFDVPILENAYRNLRLPVPWHLRDVRCWTTFRKMMGVPKQPGEAPHNALDDAKSQVATFRVAWSKLRRLEEINGDAVEK